LAHFHNSTGLVVGTQTVYGTTFDGYSNAVLWVPGTYTGSSLAFNGNTTYDTAEVFTDRSGNISGIRPTKEITQTLRRPTHAAGLTTTALSHDGAERSPVDHGHERIRLVANRRLEGGRHYWLCAVKMDNGQWRIDNGECEHPWHFQ